MARADARSRSGRRRRRPRQSRRRSIPESRERRPSGSRRSPTGVSASQSSGGALSLGWLAYNRKEFSGAEAWFKKAIVWTPAGGAPDLKALEGFARALQGERRLDDFLRFTEQWSQRVAALRPMFIEAAAQAFAAAAGDGEDVPMDLLAEAGKAFADARSANGAQALAWQRVSRRDWVTAAAWFRAAQSWSKPSEADPEDRRRAHHRACATCIRTTKPRRSPTTAPSTTTACAASISRSSPTA